MANGIYTFSTAKPEDRKFIDDLATKCKQQGVSFSWVVLQALREYETKQKEPANERA